MDIDSAVELFGYLMSRERPYSKAGDIESIANEISGRTYNYTYDKMHRLTSETVTGAGAATSADLLAYTYGNSAHVHAVSKITTNGNANPFAYDANGNMTSGKDLTNTTLPTTRTISYNTDNMPEEVTNAGSTTQFLYDGSGARAKKISAGGTTYYAGSHFEEKNGVVNAYIFAGSTRVAMITSSDTYYFHKDHLGSSSAVTNSSGAVVAKMEYMPFGGQRSATGAMPSGYRFTDQELDGETGLYNYGARLYDPVIGRFITADSIVQSPGDPQTLNRYSYCRNNPLIYTDPSGQIFGIEDIIMGAVIGAVIGGATSAATGGDIGMGMITGAIGGAFFGAAGGIIENSVTQAAAAGTMGMSSYAQAGLHFAAGAMSGGINASLTGSDVGLGMLTGGISGGIGKYAGGFLPDNFGALLLGRSFIGGVTGGMTAEIYGGSFAYGFTYGAKTGAIGFMCNDWAHFLMRAAQNRQITDEFFNSITGKGVKLLLGPVTKLLTGTTMPAEVAKGFGTVPLGQGVKSLLFLSPPVKNGPTHRRKTDPINRQF